MANGVPAVTSKQESTGFTGKCRYVGDHVMWLPGASLGHKDISSGLPFWSSVAVTGKPDAVKVCAAGRGAESLAQPGGTRRDVPGPSGLPEGESQRGKEHAR